MPQLSGFAKNYRFNLLVSPGVAIGNSSAFFPSEKQDFVNSAPLR
jgi:hypothetical protein